MAIALGSIAAGVLIGTQWRSDASGIAPRAGSRSVEFERGLERREAGERAARSLPTSSEPSDKVPQGLRTDTPGAAPADDTSDTVASKMPPDGTLFELARTAANRESLDTLAAEYSDAVAAGSDAYLEFRARCVDRFLFKTYREVLRELGRPHRVAREPSGPTFCYALDVPGAERQVTFTLGFADGHVFDLSMD